MKLLEERILKDGRMIGTDILKVDNFLNHQLDVNLFAEMGKEWKRLYANEEVTKILTIEASGIGIACIAALEFQCPVVFVKKGSHKYLSDDVYSAQIRSFTHGNTYNAIVDKKFLKKEDKVLIIDDFLASGEALHGMIDLVEQAGAKVVGCGVAIEKAFQPGGAEIRARGIRVESLARIARMDESGITFCD